MPKLVITQDGETREVALTSGDVLGRSAQNAIPLKVAEASRRHCQFTQEQGAWFVEDLGSSNGTQVNGRKVTKFELQDGDVISVGAVELRFLDMEVESAEPEVEWGDDEISLEDDIFLVIGGARRDGEVVSVPEGTLSVGRNAKHMLILKDKSVSGDHAEIVREGSTCTLRDLGSSNGTYVGGRRVTEAELQSGDVVRFGAVPCTFGIGDPAAFSAPKEVVDAGDQQSHAFTRVMQVDGDLGDDEFALSGDIPRQKETVWNIVAVVMLIGLGGAAWFFLNWEPGASRGARSGGNPSGNLVPALAWSFELPEIDDEKMDEETPEELLWDVEDGDEGSASLVNDPVLSGSFACRVERSTDGGPATLATLQQELTVSPKQGYRLSARCIEASATPCIGVVWLAQDRDADGATIYVPFARDIVRGEPATDDDWFEISGIVVAPPGASRARFGVGVTEGGGATFDEVAMVFTQVPKGRSVEHGGFISTLGRQGVVRVSRYGHRIIEGLAVEVREDGTSFEQSSLLVVNPSESVEAISGALAGGRGELTVRQAVDGKNLSVTFEGSALKNAGSLRLPLVARGDSGIQVTVLAGERGVRHLQPFAGVEADALIMGGGAHRVRVDFTSGGSALKVKASFERPKRELPVVRVDTSGLDSVTLSFQVDFSAEEQAARALVAKAKDAERHQRYGEAMKYCEEVMARYPFEENSEAEAANLHGRLVQAGRKKTAELTQRLEDAIFFRDLLRDESLEQDIAGEVARYAGTSLEGPLAALATRFDETRAAWDLPRRQRDAERAFLRAKDYMDGEKHQLALLFFKTIVANYPDTDEADQSAAYIKRLESSSGGGQH